MLRCAVLCCRDEGVNVSKCGRSVQPQRPPATRLGKIRLAKLAMRYTLLLPMRRCGPESSGTVVQGKRTIYRLCVARFVPPYSDYLAVAGAAVLSPRCCKTDPPTPLRRPSPLPKTGQWSARKPTPHHLL